jgi:galactoside O-acetyltransferase
MTIKLKNRFFYLLRRELADYIEFFVSYLPGGTGQKLRYYFYRRILMRIGTPAEIEQGIHIYEARSISIGNFFSCGRHCSLNAGGGGSISIKNNVCLNIDVNIIASIGGVVSIGNNVLIGPRVLMRTSSHTFLREDLAISKQGHRPGKILIDDDIWIGGNVTIVGDVKIGKGAVVGACALVNKDVPEYAVVGGVPAKHIKWRKKSE